MDVNGWSLAGYFLKSDNLKGGPIDLCKKKNSGWGLVAIRWLAFIGPDRF